MASFLVVSQQTLTSHAARKIPATKVALICSIWPLILWLINYSQQLTREIWLCLAIEEALTRRGLIPSPPHSVLRWTRCRDHSITVSQYYPVLCYASDLNIRVFPAFLRSIQRMSSAPTCRAWNGTLRHTEQYKLYLCSDDLMTQRDHMIRGRVSN